MALSPEDYSKLVGQSNDLTNQIYGQGPNTQYRGTVEQAYRNLGQNGPNFNPDVISGATKDLADAFIERIYEKTGQMPDENQVRDFVSGNLTQGYAQKYITGENTKDVVKSQVVDPYIQQNASSFNLPGQGQNQVDQTLGGLAGKVQSLYDQQRGALAGQIEDAYGGQKAAIAKDLAGQGMLYNQPASRQSFDALENAKGKSLMQGLSNLATGQVAGQTDISKTVANLLQNQEQIKNQASQFGQNYGLQSQALKNQLNQQDINNALTNRQLDLAGQIGRMQAQGQSNNGLAGGLGGALSGAQAGSTFGPWGTGIGAVVGGLGGYFGTKKG